MEENINNNRIPYLNMHRNQADYNEITKKLKSNINYVIIYKNVLQGDAI